MSHGFGLMAYIGRCVCGRYGDARGTHSWHDDYHRRTLLLYLAYSNATGALFIDNLLMLPSEEQPILYIEPGTPIMLMSHQAHS
jgi:hypothetical protein